MFKKILEIGPNCVDTVAHVYPDSEIVMVEPIKEIADRIPKTEKSVVVNMAVSVNPEPIQNFWFIPEKSVTREQLPEWVLTMGSLHKGHPTLIHFGWDHLLKRRAVQCITVQDLIDRYDLFDVDFIKIDTEGSDYEILTEIFRIGVKPDVVLFESKLMSNVELKQIMSTDGYKSMQCDKKDFNKTPYNTVLYKPYAEEKAKKLSSTN